MKRERTRQADLRAAGLGTYFRPRDLQPLGITFAELQRMVELGAIEKLGHGLYRIAGVEPEEKETIAMMCAALPNGIVCLLSALRVHEIGTQTPSEVWMALDRKARKPAHLPAKARIVRFSPAMLTYGVQPISILGVSGRITSPARTVVDCFRYRSKIGIDVALEAMRHSIRSRKASVDEIVRAAEVCRASSVVSIYLEAIQP